VIQAGSNKVASPWSLHGVAVIPDPSAALFLPAEKALIVADLHFEKGSAYAQRGQMLPPYDTGETLKRLAHAIKRYQPECVIALGDSFHDLRADGRMAERDAETLTSLVQSMPDWVWIEGNHDPVPPPRFGGRVLPSLQLGPLTLRHEPRNGQVRGEIAGHLHPCAKVRGKGRSVRARCFATDGARMVMPAFGAFTGGLNVCDPAFSQIFLARPDAWIIGTQDIYAVSGRRLAPQS
jgi:uncharacterized protein